MHPTDVRIFFLTLALLLIVISCVLFMLGVMRDDGLTVPKDIKKKMAIFWWLTVVVITGIIAATNNWAGVLLGPLLGTLGLIPGLNHVLSEHIHQTYLSKEEGKDADRESEQA